MRLSAISFIFMFAFSGSFGQSPFDNAEGLSDKQFVDFVIDNFYQLYSHDFDSAVDFTRKAKEISLENNWQKEAAYSSLYHGVIQYLSGNYQPALASYLFAIKAFDSLKDSRGLDRTHNEMAVYYRKNGQEEKALASLAISEEKATEANDLEALGTSYGHRAAFLTKNGKFEDAYPYIQKVLSIREEMKDSVGLGYVYLDLAEYELHNGRVSAAQEWVEKSTQIREAIGDRQGVAVNTVIKGENYFQVKDYEQAIPYFKSTIALAKEIGFVDLIRFSYDMLQKSQQELGDFEGAYESLVLSEAFSDSIFNLERTKTLLEMETKYETEKKEQQIRVQEAQISAQKALLSRNQVALAGLTVALLLLIIIGWLYNNRLKKAQELSLEKEKLRAQSAEVNASISSQEKERARYARDLHDGFGQMISTLKMHLSSLKKDDATERRTEVFEGASKVIESMYSELREICFDLMPHTLLKHGIVAGLREFAEKLNSSGKVKVDFHSFGVESRLAEIQEISLYRISQEWINNILKYADAQQITIQLTADEEEVTLLIEDDGDGFDKSLLEKSTGNGWKNLNTRTKIIHGILELETQPGRRGSSLILNVPLQLKEITTETDQKNTVGMV